MIYDSKKEVIGNIHSGWKGTLNKILRNAINLFVDKYVDILKLWIIILSTKLKITIILLVGLYSQLTLI